MRGPLRSHVLRFSYLPPHEDHPAVLVFCKNGDGLALRRTPRETEDDFWVRLKEEWTEFLVECAAGPEPLEAYTGFFNEDYPFFSLEDAQSARVIAAFAKIGKLPYITQTELARAKKVSRQYINKATKNGKYRTVPVDGAPCILLEDLDEDDLVKIAIHPAKGKKPIRVPKSDPFIVIPNPYEEMPHED